MNKWILTDNMNSEEIFMSLKLEEDTLYKVIIKHKASNPKHQAFLFAGFKTGSYCEIYTNSYDQVYSMNEVYYIEILAALCKIKSDPDFSPNFIIVKETIIQTCTACPSQWDAKTTNNDEVYIRLRGGHFRVEVNNIIIYQLDPKGYDGIMDTNKMLSILGSSGKFSIISKKLNHER